MTSYESLRADFTDRKRLSFILALYQYLLINRIHFELHALLSVHYGFISNK